MGVSGRWMISEGRRVARVWGDMMSDRLIERELGEAGDDDEFDGLGMSGYV